MTKWTKIKPLEWKSIEYHLKELGYDVDNCNASGAIDRAYLLGILHEPRYKKEFDSLNNKFREKCSCKHR